MATYRNNSLLQLLLIVVSIVYSTLLVQNQCLAQTRTNFNVLSFGAKPTGLTYSTEAFLQAWAAACASKDATLIYVPKGRYLVGPMGFRGPCKSPLITFRIDGTLVGPPDYRVLGAAESWLEFNGVNGVTVVGGSLDAVGPTLWACKASKLAKCPEGATVLY